MLTELRCLTCSAVLTGTRRKFCCQKHAMNWHNAQEPWATRKDRHSRNAAKRRAYRADPEFWQNKARKWREEHPEACKLFNQKSKEKNWLNPWHQMLSRAKRRALNKALPFDLTPAWAQKRWTGFCELTLIPFEIAYNGFGCIFSPSIDRIVPEKGYIQANCRFVLLGVNCLKNGGTDEAMYHIAKSLILHQNKLPPTP